MSKFIVVHDHHDNKMLVNLEYLQALMDSPAGGAYLYLRDKGIACKESVQEVIDLAWEEGRE